MMFEQPTSEIASFMIVANDKVPSNFLKSFSGKMVAQA